MVVRRSLIAGALATLLLSPALAGETIKVGVILSQTGPGASLGQPMAAAIKALPPTVGDSKLEFIFLDDASDATRAVADVRKLATEDNVDALVGPTLTPPGLAMVDVVAEYRIPTIAVTSSAAVCMPVDDKRRWLFKSPQTNDLMAAALAQHMAKAGVKTVGFIGYSDAYGEEWVRLMTPLLKARWITLVADERFARLDTSVVGQTLKLIAAHPDVVLIGASGTPSALPQKTLREKGFKGVIYQTHGSANNDFLRVVGKDGEGTILPVGPVLVAAQLPDSNPTKKAGFAFTELYEKAYGAGSVSTFAAHAYDAILILKSAIPAALAKGKPGTPEFRVALRDAIESLKNVVMTHGIASFSPSDHVGQDERARVLVTVKDGTWKLLE